MGFVYSISAITMANYALQYTFRRQWLANSSCLSPVEHH